MVLRPMLHFSQSMRPWRATAIHFESKNIDFVRFVNPLCVMWTYKIIISVNGRFLLCKYNIIWSTNRRYYVSKIQDPII